MFYSHGTWFVMMEDLSRVERMLNMHQWSRSVLSRSLLHHYRPVHISAVRSASFRHVSAMCPLFADANIAMPCHAKLVVVSINQKGNSRLEEMRSA